MSNDWNRGVNQGRHGGGMPPGDQGRSGYYEGQRQRQMEEQRQKEAERRRESQRRIQDGLRRQEQQRQEQQNQRQSLEQHNSRINNHYALEKDLEHDEKMSILRKQPEYIEAQQKVFEAVRKDTQRIVEASRRRNKERRKKLMKTALLFALIMSSVIFIYLYL